MTATKTTLRVLTAEDVIAGLKSLRARQPVNYSAFYSSQLGGIVTDPALMVIPFDDHMVHRGHGIFDTAALVDGKIYDLEAHLDRFLLSAERSKLRASGLARGDARHHREDDGGQRPARWLDPLLAVVRPGQPRADSGGRRRAGVLRHGVRGPRRIPSGGTRRALRVMTTTYPIKPPLYAITKATNYLPERADADGGQGGRIRQRRVHRRGGPRRRELQHERRVRHQRRRARASEVRSHPRGLHVAAAAGARAGASGSRAAERRSRCATSRSPRRARRARCCSSAAR